MNDSCGLCTHSKFRSPSHVCGQCHVEPIKKSIRRDKRACAQFDRGITACEGGYEFLPVSQKACLAPRHKFNAIPTEYDGIKFSSRAEARYYLFLKGRQAAGEILFFLRQVPFHLPGGVKYVCDFQVFETSGEVHFYDVKGMRTKEFNAKKKLVEALYPIEIELVSA